MLLEQTDYGKTKILNAIMVDPEIVVLLKEKYVDEEIWKYCIEREPSLFKKMKHPSEELCMFACEIDGANLKHIKHKFTYIKISAIMVYTAVKSNPKALLYVPSRLLTNELKKMAFTKDPTLIAYFDDNDDEFIEEMIDDNPLIIRYADQIKESIICDAIRKRPDVFVYIKEPTQKMIDILKENYPNHYNLYKNSHSDIN